MNRKSFFSYAAALGVALVLFGVCACASKRRAIDAPETNAGLAARVNGEALTESALKRRYHVYTAMSDNPEKTRRDVSLQAFLDKYLLEMLLLQEAAQKGIQVSADDVEKALAEYLTQRGLTKEAFAASLKAADLTLADAQLFFEKNRIIRKLGEETFRDLAVSDEEAKAYYDGTPARFKIPDSITASQIQICHKESKGCSTGMTKEEAKALAEDIRKRATPENFAALAKQYSTARSAAEGGSLGSFFGGAFLPAVNDALASLQAGEISPVVETEIGFHILYVSDKKKSGLLPFESVREAVKGELQETRMEQALIASALELKEKAAIQIFGISGDDGAVPPSPFETFTETGDGRLTNRAGRPVILFFSTSSCPHCTWVGDSFDMLVKDYMDRGLIEAHHYDLGTGDDLLTKGVEKKIPEAYLGINERRNPKGYVPYFYFGGKYERSGTGNEAKDDLAAEMEEMNEVITTLLQFKGVDP